MPTETNSEAKPQESPEAKPQGSPGAKPQESPATKPQESPGAELERLREQLRNEHEMYLRALADFENYRRRVDRENSRTVQSGKREIVLSLLEVLDGFDRAFQHAEKSPSSLFEGLQAIHRKLLGVLQAQGIAPFDSVGQAFNPQLHEAIAAVAANGHPSGTVVDDVQRGYRWGGEVLRPARVRVAQ